MPNIDDIDLTPVTPTTEVPPTESISPFYQKVADAYIRHGNIGKAYREAGGKEADRTQHARLARLILYSPAVAAYLKSARAQLAEEAKYDAVRAMTEAAEAIKFAKKTKNASAYVKAVELRSRLTGLLIDKHDIRQVGAFSINIKGVDDVPAIPATVVQHVVTKSDEDEEEDE